MLPAMFAWNINIPILPTPLRVSCLATRCSTDAEDYPTQADAIKKAADAYNRTRLTPTVKSLLRRWMAW